MTAITIRLVEKEGGGEEGRKGGGRGEGRKGGGRGGRKGGKAVQIMLA